MNEFLRQIIASWYTVPTLVLLGLVAAGLYSFWARDYWRRFIPPEGYTMVDTALYKKEQEENKYLHEMNNAMAREIADLKAQPKPDRLTPVIDWIGWNVVAVDYDADIDELQVAYVSEQGYSSVDFREIPQGMAIQLSAEFAQAVKQKHQPAAFR